MHRKVPNSGGETQASFFKREDEYAKNYTSRKRDHVEVRMLYVIFVGICLYSIKNDDLLTAASLFSCACQFTVANSMHAKFTTSTKSTQQTTKSEFKGKDTVAVRRKTKKSSPCGECEGCTREDCGQCRYCKDKRKNGGPDKLKKRCSARECVKNISTAGGDGGATGKMTDTDTSDTSPTDSVSSSSSLSPEGLGFALKRKAPSSSSLGEESSSPTDTLIRHEPKKKRARPLFKMKLNINMNSVPKEEGAVLKEVSSNQNALNDTVSIKPAVLEKVSTKTNVLIQSKLVDDKCTNTNEGNISVHQLLSLAKKRALEAQSNLTLAQLKQQAREKARAAKAASVRKQPKRNKKGKFQKSSSSVAKDDDEMPEEPMAKIEMHTGFLHLYRGENPRAKFVWRKY